MSEMGKDLWLILPQIIVLLAAISALVFEMLHKPKVSLWAMILGFIAAPILSLMRLPIATTAFSGTFRVGFLNHWSVIILCPATVLVAMLVRHELKNTPREGTVYSLLAFSTLGALLLAGSGDLMFIVLGVLISSLSGFALAAYTKTDAATEGAMKYFVYGSVAGAVMIFGLTYWAGMAGSTLLEALPTADMLLFPYIIGFGCLLTGLGYMASLFPFHFWTPDTFEGSPVSIAAFLSVIPKIGAFFALAQVMQFLPEVGVNIKLVLATVAVFSMTYGNIVALWQTNTIRLLSYSTIAQAGYFLLAMVAIPESTMALPALVVFSLAYAAMNIGAFAVTLLVGTELILFSGLGKAKPFMAVAVTVFLLSLVGIPPLAGFAGKFMLFTAAIESGYTWLAIIAVINSTISLAVYLKIIWPSYFKSKEPVQYTKSWLISAVTATCLLVTILAGIGMEIFLKF